MKKKAIGLVIFLASISLIGIVLTQLYWVNKSLDLRKDQFDKGIEIAVKIVINQLIEQKNDSAFKARIYELSCKKLKIDITDVIEPQTLDSLLHLELGNMISSRNFYYGIYNRLNDRFVAGNFLENEKELIDTPYQVSLKSVYHPGDYYLSVFIPGQSNWIIQQMQLWLLLSVFFLVILIISFVYVITTILQQKKLTEMKSDFINNMTHEFKTPISTSALAAEMLLKPEVQEDKKRVKKYAHVILDESARLQSQVEQVLQISILEKGKYRFKFKKTNVHQLLNTANRNFNLRIKENKIRVSKRLKAEDYFINADKAQLLNVFNNLIDNAIKYCSEKPELQIKTWNVPNGIIISFQDNGIGISPEHQKNIFKNLYRVPTGNIHEVRGFGLGLYYVKTVIDQHKGEIDLKSELGKGSTFNVFLPFHNE
ncbi:MAG TPA: HAMP domain-containing sensor histidine kinase [Bacteroidales bacterium]